MKIETVIMKRKTKQIYVHRCSFYMILVVLVISTMSDILQNVENNDRSTGKSSFIIGILQIHGFVSPVLVSKLHLNNNKAHPTNPILSLSSSSSSSVATSTLSTPTKTRNKIKEKSHGKSKLTSVAKKLDDGKNTNEEKKMSIKEMREYTNDFLDRFSVDDDMLQTTANSDKRILTKIELHEILKLMSYWSKLKHDFSGSMTNRLFDILLEHEEVFISSSPGPSSLPSSSLSSSVRLTEPIILNQYTFHLAISAWLNSRSKSDPKKAASIFKGMISSYRHQEEQQLGEGKRGNSVSRYPMPNVALCNIIIESLGKITPKTKYSQRKRRENALLAQELHDLIQNLYDNVELQNDDLMSSPNSPYKYSSNKTSKPDLRTYHGVMYAWAQVKDYDSGKRAEDFLNLMKDYERKKGTPLETVPSTKSYNIVLHAWANTPPNDVNPSPSPSSSSLQQSSKVEEDEEEMIYQFSLIESALSAERILKEMSPSTSSPPDIISYTTVLTAWANAANANKNYENNEKFVSEVVIPKVHALLDHMKEEGQGETEPDIFTYNALLNVYSRWCSSSHHAEELLKQIQHMYEVEGNQRVKPDLITYNSVINSIAASIKQMKTPSPASSSDQYNEKKASLEAAHRAREILEYMENNEDERLKPDVVTYNSVLKAYSNCHDLSAAQISEEILERMEKNQSISPDSYSYNTVIHCWANVVKLASNNQRKNRNNANKHHSHQHYYFYHQMQKNGQPQDNYDDQLSTYATKKAEALLYRMSKRSSDSANSSSKVSLKPTSISYNSVLNALSKTINDPNAPMRSEAILTHMLDSFDRQREDEKESRSKQRMANTVGMIKPDVYSFSTVIYTWSKSKHPDRSQKALVLLRKLQEFHKMESDSSFSGSKSNKRSKTSSIRSSSRTKPNVYVYTSVLNACAHYHSHNNNNNKYSRSTSNNYKQQQQLMVNATLPILTEYKFDDRDESQKLSPAERAFNTAVSVFQEMQHDGNSNCRPNHVTYATFFKVCATSTSIPHEIKNRSSTDMGGKQREKYSNICKILRDTWEQCIKDGQVGQATLTQFKRATPRDLFQELVLDHIHGSKRSSYHDDTDVSIKDIPRKWKRNVRDKKGIQFS